MSIRNFLFAGLITGSCWSAASADDPKLFAITAFGPNFPQPGSIQSGFIDETGKVVIPLTADYMVMPNPVSPVYFTEGLQPVTVGLNPKWPPNSWGYLDTTGKFAIEPPFGSSDSFSEGVAAVGGTKGPPWPRGYIDHTGKFVIDPQFESARPFSSGRAIVQKEGDWLFGAIDHSGKWVVPAQYPSMADFHEGLACVAKYVTPRDHPPGTMENAPMVWGFIDINGAQVIDFKFKEPSSFSEGLAAINDGGACGYIDKTGAYVIPPNFAMGWDFSEGVARVQTKDGKMEYIDHKGDVAFAVPGLSWAEPFSEGLAEARVRAKPRESPNGWMHGFIDHTGKFVIAPQYIAASSFHNGLAQVASKGETGYIDKTGQFVWKTKVPDMKALFR
jgi:hypothetical protein